VDRGQVEGGFVQGMGWLTTEECVWDDDGRLLTTAPSRCTSKCSGTSATVGIL